MQMNKTQCISEEQATLGLAALGNQTRLRLFKLLVKAGRSGLNIGEIQKLMDVPASTMARHLAALSKADLIKQTRQSREVICTANFDMMHNLTVYLTDECCDGVQLLDSVENG